MTNWYDRGTLYFYSNKPDSGTAYYAILAVNRPWETHEQLEDIIFRRVQLDLEVLIQDELVDIIRDSVAEILSEDSAKLV